MYKLRLSPVITVKHIHCALVIKWSESVETKQSHASSMKWVYYLQIGSKDDRKLRLKSHSPKVQESCLVQMESDLHVPHLDRS